MSIRPKIDDAPGLTWKPRKGGWEARWQCRSDLAARGYRPRTFRLMRVDKPLDDFDTAWIQDRCKQLQGEMLAWSQQGLPVVATFDGTMRSLIDNYRGSKNSHYNKKCRYNTRKFYDALCQSLLSIKWHDENGLERNLSQMRVTEIKRSLLEEWYEIYLNRGHIAMGHQCMSMLRTLFGFGGAVMEDANCARLCMVLSKMRFQQPQPRNEILTAEMVTLIRTEANRRGFHSMALAQAFQFDGMFRQKDVIGEWVPANEKRTPLTEILSGGEKWIRGLRWEEIDKNMILTHVTSKRQKAITLNLRLMPMVMEELGNPVLRSQLPDKGPVIIHERLNEPWYMTEYRRKWRECANAVGIPNAVKNMDSRAGAITEASMTGAPLESIKHAATHSDISMTQRYARAAETKIEQVQRARMEYRNKTGS